LFRARHSRSNDDTKSPKGSSSVYFQHEHTGHSIGAEKYESELVGGKAILRFTLRPVSSGQRYDEEYLNNEPLEYLSIDDGRVIDGFARHVDVLKGDVESWEVHVISRGKALIFGVKPKNRDFGRRSVLEFQVLRANDKKA